MDCLAVRTHIHPVDYIPVRVRVYRILFVASRTHSHHRIAAVVADNNSHPMNYRQTNAIHRRRRLLQMPQSKEIVANTYKREKQNTTKRKKIKPLIRML